MKKTILYAEDNEYLRETMLEFFEDNFSDYDIESFETGDLLEERLERGLNGVCAVVTDDKMPCINGSDIIRKYSPRLKVPFILHSNHPQIEKIAKECGAYAYVDKCDKCGKEVLIDTLRSAINDSTQSSQ